MKKKQPTKNPENETAKERFPERRFQLIKNRDDKDSPNKPPREKRIMTIDDLPPAA